jgi:hypothetical protein
MKVTEDIQENFPFLSVIKHVKNEYVSVIINQDQQVTSIYDYGYIKTAEEKQKFIELCEIWWWESNRQIPINIFLGNDIIQYKYAIKHFNTKDVIVVFGPITSLHNIIVKRCKKKSITLVKRLG